jgi:hypothetical protein
MTFQAGLTSRYYVGPQRFSVFGKSISVEANVAQLDVSSQEDVAQVFIYGQKNGSASIEMMLDTTTTALQFTTLNTWQTTPQPVTVAFDGAALAATNVWLLLGNQSSVTYASGASDMVTANVSIQPDGPADWGQVIAAEAAVTVDGNGTAVDGGAATTNGGVAHIHSTAFSGLTNNIVTIEGSADGVSSWATISGGTFATITATGSQRLVIAPGVSVPRYLRVVDNVTGAGSHTRFVAFARR